MEKEELIKTIKIEIKDIKNRHFLIWSIVSLLGISAAVYLGGGLIFAIPSVIMGTIGHKISTQVTTKKLREELSKTVIANEKTPATEPQVFNNSGLDSIPQSSIEPNVVSTSSITYEQTSQEEPDNNNQIGRSR